MSESQLNSPLVLRGNWGAYYENGQTVFRSGTTTYSGVTYVQTGGTLTVYNGATVSNVRFIPDNGIGWPTVNVSSGGTLISSYVENGYVNISSGGVSQSNIWDSIPGAVSSGGTSIDDKFLDTGYGVDTVSFNNGSVINNATVSSGGSVVASTAVNGITVAGGGKFTAGPGSVINGLKVVSGAQIVFNGGITNPVRVPPALALPTNATTVNGTSWSAVNSAGVTYYQSGTVSLTGPIRFPANTTLIVTAGAVVSGAYMPPIGTLQINSGGTVISSYIENGYLNILSGGASVGNYYNSPRGNLYNGSFSTSDVYYDSGYGADTMTLWGGATLDSPYLQSGIYMPQASSVAGGAAATVINPSVTQGAYITYTQKTTDVCFLAGTKILTTKGYKNIEHITSLDGIICHNPVNNVKKICYPLFVGKGRSEYNKSNYLDESGLSICVKKGAISENVPMMDLFITAEHCLYIDGHLFPARTLVNGLSIHYDTENTEYDYYHISFRDHEIIFANGMMTESFIDTGNRHMFSGLSEEDLLLLASSGTARHSSPMLAAPLGTHPTTLQKVYSDISSRAGVNISSKKSERINHNSKIYLMDDHGTRYTPTIIDNFALIFQLPSNLKRARLLSPASRPFDLIGCYMDDRRVLGLLVGDIHCRHGDETWTLDRHLTETDISGWHNLEAMTCRWTNGDGLITIDIPSHLSISNGSIELSIKLLDYMM